MSTLYEVEAGQDSTGVVGKPTPTALGLWNALGMQALVATKKGIWLDCVNGLVSTTPGSPIRGGLSTDAAANYSLLDRCANRVFTKPSTKNGRPVTADDGSGKPISVFGAGTFGSTTLTASDNGVILDQTLATIFDVGAGLSAVIDIWIPTASTTAFGIAFGSSVGGVVFGGAGSDSPSCSFTISYTTGFYTWRRNDGGADIQVGNVDLRGARFKLILVYNAGTGKTDIYTYNAAGALVATDTTSAANNDFAAANADGRTAPQIGAVSNTYATRFIGGLKFLLIRQSDILTDSTIRAQAIAHTQTL